MNNEYVAIKKSDLQALIGFVSTLLDFIDVDEFEHQENIKLINEGYDKFAQPLETVLRNGNVIGDEILAKDVELRQFKVQLSDIYGFDVTNITDKQLTELYDDVQAHLSGDDNYSEIYNEAVDKVMSEFLEKTKKVSSLEDKIKQADEKKENCFDNSFINRPEKER